MFVAGKYRENELITLLPTDKSSSGMFAIRTKKLRERIDNAVMEANQASQIALQKTDIAMARCAVRRIDLLNLWIRFHCTVDCIV